MSPPLRPDREVRSATPEAAPVTAALPTTGTPVPSPCVNVCRMNDRSGLCEGCGRTLDEIAAWSRLDDEAKRAIWTLLDQRRAQLAMAAGAAR